MSLHAGTDSLSFRLSKAMYCLGEEGDMALGADSANDDSALELVSLAPKGAGVTAFTFDGAMNPDAPWENLLKESGYRSSILMRHGKLMCS